MTTQRRDGKIIPGFGYWVSHNPRLDAKTYGVANMDPDWIWHKWKTHRDKIGDRTIVHIMLIEEKRCSTDLTLPQRDTMYIIDQILRHTKTKRLRNVHGELINCRVWGYFKLKYNSDYLETATEIWWNKKKIDLAILEKILLFELNPRTLDPRSDRRHHAERLLPLFY
jgi:hypothetical protein